MSTESKIQLLPQRSNFKSLVLDSLTLGFVAVAVGFVVLNPTHDDILAKFSSYCGGVFLIGVLSALLAGILNFVGIKTLGLAIFEPAHQKNVTSSVWYKNFWGIQVLVWFAVAFYAGIKVTNFSFFELMSEEGFAGARRIFSSLFHPNMSIFASGVLAVIETIFIAFVATVLAIPPAFVLSFFGAKNIMGKTKFGFGIYVALRSGMNVTRSIEPLIWAIIFSVWVGIGPFAGMMALMIQSVASLTKQYSEIIECINDGPVEGILSTGAGKLQVIWFAVVPQIVLPSVAFTIYRWDINVRMATIIGLVGGGGIGTMLMQYQGQAQWSEVGCLVLIIASVVWFMDTTSAYLREAIK